jgi:ribonuclease PH
VHPYVELLDYLSGQDVDGTVTVDETTGFGYAVPADRHYYISLTVTSDDNSGSVTFTSTDGVVTVTITEAARVFVPPAQVSTFDAVNTVNMAPFSTSTTSARLPRTMLLSRRHFPAL